MKKQIVLGICSFLIATSGLMAEAQTGKPAPDFSLKDTKGQEHKLSDYQGKYVVLEWTNHECPFVKKFYKNSDMQKWQEEMGQDDVVWLQVVSSAEGTQGYCTAEEGEELITKTGTKAKARLLDPTGEVGKKYGAKTTPHMFLINEEGVLIYQGALDNIRSTNPEDVAQAKNYIKTAYQEAKAGKEVSTSNTPPYGCGVKYAQ